MSKKKGLNIITVENAQMGMMLAKDFLYKEVDEQTLLLLSGGSQKILYEMLAQEKKLKPFAVAMVDERFGEKMHENSNEKMIRETGLIADLETRRVVFYPVLSGNTDIAKTAVDYERTMKDLLSKAGKKVAILGIGPDGHTAGIVPNRLDFSDPLFSQQGNLVGWFNDATSSFGKRVTTTFDLLIQMDILLILAFSSSKQEPLKKMFADGPIEEIPARFYTLPEVAKKTILITDQKI